MIRIFLVAFALLVAGGCKVDGESFSPVIGRLQQDDAVVCDMTALRMLGARAIEPKSGFLASVRGFVPNASSDYLDEHRPRVLGFIAYPLYLPYDLVTGWTRARNFNEVETVRYYSDGPGRTLYDFPMSSRADLQVSTVKPPTQAAEPPAPSVDADE